MHVRTQGNPSIAAYAVHEKGKALEKFEYIPEPLGPWDVELSIDCCGVCHSDVHLIDDDWEMGAYPLVPGHEIVGTVHEKGGMVQHLKIGQRVGVGWVRSACLQCELCIRGDEHLCPNAQATCVQHFGGFAEDIRLDSRFVFPIPDELDSENAAPLLCGGITVYSPLRRHVRPWMRVGVIGVGGLGHLALQFAKAFGCEVTAFSSTPDKKAEAIRLGARHFISSSDPKAMQAAAGRLDFILSTVTANLDWNAFMNTLRPDGTLCFVGVPNKDISVPVFSLLGGRKAISGSVTGGRSEIREMLAFAARHKIQAQVETVPMSEANAAVDRVRKNQARYRMVLKNVPHSHAHSHSH